MEAKERERKMIERQVADFLAKGGRIKTIEEGRKRISDEGRAFIPSNRRFD
mgnify:FL=1